MTHADLPSPDVLTTRFASVVGDRHVLVAAADTARYCVEGRGIFKGRPRFVVRPACTGEVADIVRLAAEAGLPIVPQGGNTGLTGAQVPDETGQEVVVSLERLDRIRSVDPEDSTMTVEAGVVLARIQDAAADVDRLFPLALGAQGSCQIGGNISTNAGGTGVLAYGNTRDLVLGLEVVLAGGRIWDGLRRLKKDNTGYALKHLFIGAEGTLGIVTAAVLKLVAKPKGRAVAILGLSDPQAALGLLNLGMAREGPALTGFELMPRISLSFLIEHGSGHRDPMTRPHPWYVLIELSSSRSETDASERLATLLEAALEKRLIDDAAIAQSLAQLNAFWAIRHELPDAQKAEGVSLKHDVSVPVARVPDLLRRAEDEITRAVPGARPVMFGHMGDGNIHLNVSQPVGAAGEDFRNRESDIGAIVYKIVRDLGGSVAAEHGIGRLKRQLLTEVKSDVELDMMRAVKKALDPDGLFNPGRVL